MRSSEGFVFVSMAIDLLQVVRRTILARCVGTPFTGPTRLVRVQSVSKRKPIVSKKHGFGLPRGSAHCRCSILH